MTVVEAYVGGDKMDQSKKSNQISDKLVSLLIEGIAQNTSGSVFMPEVNILNIL
jgi:P-type Ca2+ transporter type 2C